MHTLGESAALGAAGVVLWGEMKFAKSKVRSVCERVTYACVFMCVTLSLQSRSPASVHRSQRLHTHCPGSIRAEAEVQHPSLQPPALPRQWALRQATLQLGSHVLLSSSHDLWSLPVSVLPRLERQGLSSEDERKQTQTKVIQTKDILVDVRPPHYYN